MTLEPTVVVERFIAEVLSGGRPESASELVASEPLRLRVEAFRRAFPDLQVRVVRVVARGSLVAVHLSAMGTQTGLFQGSPPTGRAMATSGTAIYEVVDGCIVDFWLTWDSLAIAEQLGMVRRTESASA